MACSMMKKGVLGAALGVGALYAAFGTSAPGYVRTAFHKFRHNVKHSVPVPFEIDHARDQIARLEPSIRDNLENMARASVEVEQLERELALVRANQAKEKDQLVSLRSLVNSGDTLLAGNVTYTANELKSELKQRFDRFTQTEDQLKIREETLKAKQKALTAGMRQLSQMKATRDQLTAQLAGIEARLKMIETTQESNEFHFNDTDLSRAKASVADLEKRLDVMARTSELEGKFAGSSTLVIPDEPGRDIVREMDARFGPAPAAKTPAKGEKSL